jgi:hypothetical protein
MEKSDQNPDDTEKEISITQAQARKAVNCILHLVTIVRGTLSQARPSTVMVK